MDIAEIIHTLAITIASAITTTAAITIGTTVTITKKKKKWTGILNAINVIEI